MPWGAAFGMGRSPPWIARLIGILVVAVLLCGRVVGGSSASCTETITDTSTTDTITTTALVYSTLNTFCTSCLPSIIVVKATTSRATNCCDFRCPLCNGGLPAPVGTECFGERCPCRNCVCCYTETVYEAVTRTCIALEETTSTSISTWTVSFYSNTLVSTTRTFTFTQLDTVLYSVTEVSTTTVDTPTTVTRGTTVTTTLISTFYLDTSVITIVASPPATQTSFVDVPVTQTLSLSYSVQSGQVSVSLGTITVTETLNGGPVSVSIPSATGTVTVLSPTISDGSVSATLTVPVTALLPTEIQQTITANQSVTVTQSTTADGTLTLSAPTITAGTVTLASATITEGITQTAIGTSVTASVTPSVTVTQITTANVPPP